ncbi:hypothetical protein BGW42_007728, partial [Actinomortierella wolfii]
MSVEADDALEGILVPGLDHPVKNLAYADDVLLILRNRYEWERTKSIFTFYSEATNGKLNLNKTVAFPFTSRPNQELKLALADDGVDWHDENTRDPETNEPTFLRYLGYPVPISKGQIKSFLLSYLKKIKA